MKITEWKVRELGETSEISADVDGFRLWYRVPLSVPYARTADPFAAAALLPAMLRGGPLEIAPGLPLSPKLGENLRGLQDIHHCWNPLFGIVPIEAAAAPAAPFRDGAAAFFSGGVDSTYTFLKKRSELTQSANQFGEVSAVVSRSILHNPSIKHWLGGIEPVWTLLDQSRLRTH